MRPARFLTTILHGILPHPDDLRIEQETAGEVIVLSIYLPKNDRRFVVGKRGRNIEAIRSLLRAYGGRHGITVVTKLSDEGLRTEVTNEADFHSVRQ